jgi:uncharacterized protein
MHRLFLTAMLLAAPALAQDGPSFDCGGARGAAETLVCADPELAALDRAVAGRYRAALAAVRALDAGAAAAEDALKTIQRGWLGGRDECWKAADPRGCVASAYLRREAELVATYMLELPSSSATWTCGGNPANEVVTLFFATPLPSVRFERGDSIDAGVQVRTASGARYDGSFGRWIWIKGETATYREPDPDGTEYGCALAK